MLTPKIRAAMRLACVCLAGTAAQAEQAPIVISSGRTEAFSVDTPASISVVGRGEIENGASKTLPELMRSRSGIHIRDFYGDGGGAVMDMRGFGPTAGSNTLIMVDGRRLNNSSDLAPPDLTSIDLSSVERVEVIQGSAGTLFGNQAVGGVINVITRRPERFGAELTGGAGSYNGYELRGRVSDRLDSGLAYRVNAGTRETDNYRDQNTADRDNLSLRLDYEYSSGRLFLEQEWLREDLELPGSLYREELAQDRRQSAPAYEGDFSDTETLVSRIGLRQPLGDAWSLEGELTYRENDRRFQTSFRSFPGSLSTQDRRVWGFNPRLIGLAPWGRSDLKLTLGADLESTDYQLRTAFGPQTQNQHIRALYGQLAAPLKDGWKATVGLRHAGVDDSIGNNGAVADLDDAVTVGSAGLVYRPAAGWRLFARWDQNFRFPKVDELTNVVTGQPADLRTQTGNTYELGAELALGQLQGKALVYRLDLKDEISFDSSTFFNVNLDRTRRTGALLELSWSVDRAWSLGGNYTYTDSSVTDGPFDGNELPLVPAHQGRLYLDYASPTGFGANAEAQLTGEQILGGDFQNQFKKLDAFTVVNVTARYHKDSWRFSARVNNLFDEIYSETGAVGFDTMFVLRDAYFPSPERNFWITAQYQFAD